MKYGYIALEPIVAEVRAQFKLLTQTGQLDNDDCMQYAVEALREIGHNNYETKEEYLFVRKHRVALPSNIYKIREVRTTKRVNEIPIGLSYMADDTFYLVPGIAILPSDNTPARTYDSAIFGLNHDNKLKFNFQQPPGIITLPFTEDYVYIKYRYMKQDDNGNYMMQSNEESVKAVKNYILYQCLKPMYFTNQIPQHIYVKAEVDYDISMRDAINAQKALDESEINAMVNKKNRKFDRFKILR